MRSLSLEGNLAITPIVAGEAVGVGDPNGMRFLVFVPEPTFVFLRDPAFIRDADWNCRAIFPKPSIAFPRVAKRARCMIIVLQERDD